MYTLTLRRRLSAQYGKLPLQMALQFGARVEVVAALLAAHPQAEVEVDSAEHRGMLERAKAQGQPLAGATPATQQVGRIYSYCCLLPNTEYLLRERKMCGQLVVIDSPRLTLIGLADPSALCTPCVFSPTVTTYCLLLTPCSLLLTS